ncbi:DUF885 domain-containing protein [Roseiterribacter gracilis]|uniref:DUF885 domain-containing protein n=1 Tax=Roseiterribacter gracilis TaxID=2812848 RepID=A0A8S8XFZ8_9PROT|nr:hypothetical protein TMPK1_31290 [Rhodospirillales bacterium TMPK1]
MIRVVLLLTLLAAPPETALRQVIADFERFDRADDPVSAGQDGDRAQLSRLPDVKPAADRARTQALQTFKTRLAAIDAKTLSADAQLNLAVLRATVDDRLALLSFDVARLPFNSDSGFHTMLRETADATAIDTVADAEAWLARLDAAPVWYADNIENARRGLATGFVQPRMTTERVLEIAKTQAATPVEFDPLLKPLAKLPATIADGDALRTRAKTILRDKVAPARAAFVTFLETEYLPKSRASLGASEMNNGRAYYAAAIKHYTTTSMTPDQVHALGLSEVARIRTAMDAVMAEAKFNGSFTEFLAFLRSDKRFYAQSREELLLRASEIAKRIDGQLPRVFRTLPRLPYGVTPVAAEIELAYTTGRYSPGSPTLGVAGQYLVNTSKLDQRPLYELPALTLHEAVPGHHLQIALQQELGEQPWFRRHADVTAFVEGWGLYSESLGTDLGIYRDAYEKFGRLSYEMWRACRLVADTGIHWKGWSIEQARACFTDNSALAPHNIQTELERYISWPGQATAYKIGELKLQALRAKATAALGDKFNLRDFHDAVLLGGPLPLDLLEQRVDRWIAQQANRRS